MVSLSFIAFKIYNDSVIILVYWVLCVGIEPWTFVQNLGDAVFIPAGCPHQVRNLKVISKHFCRLRLFKCIYIVPRNPSCTDMDTILKQA